MPSKKQAKTAAPGPAEIPAPFHESYGPLLAGLPDSVIQKVKSRASARGLDVAIADDYIILEIIEGAREAYERKKQGSRLSAAKRRAAAKAAPAVETEAAIEAAPAEAPAEAPATESTPLP